MQCSFLAANSSVPKISRKGQNSADYNLRAFHLSKALGLDHQKNLLNKGSNELKEIYNHYIEGGIIPYIGRLLLDE